MQFYILIYLLNKLFRKHGKLYWSILLSFSLLADISYTYVKELFPHPILGKLYSQTVIPYAFLFLIGCFICEYKDKLIPILRKTWWLFGLISLIPLFTGWDIPGSYGIYLFHMVIVNVLIMLNMKGNILSLPILLVMVILLAWLSHTIVNYKKTKAEN